MGSLQKCPGYDLSTLNDNMLEAFRISNQLVNFVTNSKKHWKAKLQEDNLSEVNLKR